jgi:hypothetical protein
MPRRILATAALADAEKEIVRVARALDRETALISAAASDLERIQKP